MKKESNGTFVAMRVKNNTELHDWFKNQGVKVIQKSELHSTIAFSRKSFNHSLKSGNVTISKLSLLEISSLGDDGAIVLKFNSKEMQERFNITQKEGALYNYDSYIPHITITYDGESIDISKLKMPDFDITLEDEYVEDLDIDWKDKFNDNKIVSFQDKKILTLDENQKTAISIRDGYQEYMGSEIGVQPFDRIFKIVRDKSDIIDLADKLINIPITNEHIEPEGEINSSIIQGFINSSEVVKHRDIDTDTNIIIRNGINLNDNMLQFVNNGKNELSLGYKAKLVPHNLYDFKQVEIVPHHLAIVQSGRCGDICKFTDGEIMENSFLDADGTVSLERVMELATQLPEVISKMDKKELDSIIPILEKAMESAGINKPEHTPEPEMEKEVVAEDEKMPIDEKEVSEKAVEEFKDSKCFIDAQIKFADDRVLLIDKAKSFLDEDYLFIGKSNLDIMADVLKAEKPSESFADNEMAVAFKMLNSKEPIGDYKDFGDKAHVSKWDKAESEEL